MPSVAMVQIGVVQKQDDRNRRWCTAIDEFLVLGQSLVQIGHATCACKKKKCDVSMN